MADINLQPTDRCILKSMGIVAREETTTNTHMVTASSTGISIIDPETGVETTRYEGSLTVSFSLGKITNVTTTFVNTGIVKLSSLTHTDNSYTIKIYSIIGGKGATIPVTVTYQVESEGEIENEVFQIKDSNGKYKWFKCKPVTISFDTNKIEVIEWEENAVEVGGGADTNEPGTYYIRAGGSWSNIAVHPKDGYVVSSNGLTDAMSQGLLDLTDVANLTLNDFEPLTLNITAEEMVTVDPTQRIIDLQYILDYDLGLLMANTITTQYREYVDYGASYVGLREGQRSGDTFIAYGYLTPPWGEAAVPVIYKTDYSNQDVIDEGYPTDYEDIYYYVGQGQVNGVLYDKWRKIDSHFSYGAQQKKYLYTNIITRDLLEGPVVESVTTGYNTDTSRYYVEVTLSKPETNSESYPARVTVVADGPEPQTTYLFYEIESGTVTSSDYALGTLDQLRTDADVIVTAIFRDPASGHQISTATVYETNLSS